MTELNQQARSKRFLLKFLAGIMLLSSSLFLGLLADLPHIPIMVLLGWLLALIVREPFKVSDRSITYSILLAVSVATLLGYFYPFERGRLGFFSYFFKPEYYCAFALNIALVSCFFQSTSLIAGTTISAVVFVLGTCGDINDLNYLNLRFIWGSHWINLNYARAYIAMLGMELILALLLLNFSRPPSHSRLSRRFSFAALRTLSLLLLAACAAWIFYLHAAFEKEIRNFEQSFVAVGGHSLFRHLLRRTEPFFADSVDLNRPFFFGDEEREKRVLLRVNAPSPPGYLRSCVFRQYGDGRWSAPEKYEFLPLLAEEPAGLLAMTRYRRETCIEQQDARFDIYFSSALHSSQLAVPVPFARIDLIADNLSADIEGQIVPTKWRRDAGYVVYGAAGWEPGQAFDLPWLDKTQLDDYLQVPKNLVSELQLISAQFPAFREETSDAERCAGLLRQFHRDFIYHLGEFREMPDESSASGGRSARRWRYLLRQRQMREEISHRRVLREIVDEPVLQFLRSKSGHCELFASAAVLLLRQNGIPARYVTGFLCFERHPSGEYYVSRLGHAHAWCEAFDRQQHKWLLIDPTPPDGIRDYADKWSFAENWQDRLRHLLEQIVGGVQRGLFASAILSALKLLGYLVWNPVGILISTLLLFACLQYWRKQRKKELLVLTKEKKLLADEFKKTLRFWEKKLRLEKLPSRTAGELLVAARESKELSDDEFAELEKQVGKYEKARFYGDGGRGV